MKKYILFTYNIYPLGGSQAYNAAKVRYLKANGWDVSVLFPKTVTQEPAFKSLDEYKDNGLRIFEFPPYYFSNRIVEQTLERIITLLNISSELEKVIIESNECLSALWGELLAQKINCKHFCFIIGERFRDPVDHYIDNLSFFKFKLDRGELAGNTDLTIDHLLGTEYKVGRRPDLHLAANEGNMPQEVEYPFLSEIQPDGWRICYFGRIKGCTYFITKSVIEFARRHSEKKIQYILAGLDKGQSEELDGLLESRPDNLTTLYTGMLLPIPKKLFECVDVTLAASGCALISAHSGCPTIISDGDTLNPIGISGYTTNASLYGDNISDKSYEEYMEDILVKNFCKTHPYKPDNNPFFLEPEVAFRDHDSFIESSSQDKEYYSVLFTPKTHTYSFDMSFKIFIINLFGIINSEKIFSIMRRIKSPIVSLSRRKRNGEE